MSLIKVASNVSGLARLVQGISINNSPRNVIKIPNLSISTSPVVFKAPTRKTKKDPQLIKAREDKRKVRLEKALKKMGKKKRVPKPVLELRASQQLLRELEIRKRDVVITEEIEDERIDLIKEWSTFNFKRYKNELKKVDSVIIAQRKALETLRILNIELYKKAIQLDTNLLPFSAMGPYYTPPIPGYIQDGEYEDTTKKYEIVYVDTEAHMKSILRGKNHKRKKKSEEE